jgi:hypothetical protein
MALVIKGRTSVFLKDEVTENTYVAPATAADAVEVLEDFSGFEYSRETIERAVLSNTVESEAPRAGLPDVVGTLPTELKAAATEGAAPRANVLYKSLMGGRRQSVALEVDAGSTTTVINLVDASTVNVGDSLHFKVAGNHFVRPVASKASNAVTLAFAAPVAPAAGVDVSALTTYYHATNDGSFSTTAELGQEISEQATGCKVESGEISNWSTGSIPQISFALKALGLDKVDSVSGIVPDFSGEPQPPVALDAKAYLGGTALEYSEFSLNINNTLNDVLSCAKPQGKLASRLTNFLVTGSINPYMESADVSRFEKFNESTSTNLFIYVANPSSTDGEFSNVVALWMPKIVFTSVNNGDADGVLTDEIEFQASKTVSNDTLFLTFI